MSCNNNIFFTAPDFFTELAKWNRIKTDIKKNTLPFMLNLLVPQVIPDPRVTTPSGCPKELFEFRSNFTPLKQVVRMRRELDDRPEFRS